ncbi:MAG: hypothetical protein NUV57_00240 [archaeon]|nr:hypothetical protein [archaeon]
MEFKLTKGIITFERKLSDLDKLVLKFCKILEKNKIDYVIISGYIAILFGRSRNTEDVDLFIEEMEFTKFKSLWDELYQNGFECINESKPERVYNEYLKNSSAIRFAEKGKFIPNFELKFPKTRYNNYSLKNKLKVIINGKTINASELELQIAFKLYLGTDKDFEDARHLYKTFEEKLNMGLLTKHIIELKVEKQAEKILWKKYRN